MPGEVPVTEAWDAEAKAVTDGKVLVRLPGAPDGDIDRLGWGEAMELHRPFLSHSELEVMLSRPSELYDNARAGEALAALAGRAPDVQRLPELATGAGAEQDPRGQQRGRRRVGQGPEAAPGCEPGSGPAVDSRRLFALRYRLFIIRTGGIGGKKYVWLESTAQPT